MDRKMCMAWYIWEVCDKKQRLTLQNLPSLMKYNLIPTEGDNFILARRVYEFNRYLKAITKADSAAYKDFYTLDTRAINFLQEIGQDEIMTTDNLAWFVKQKDWDKVYQKYMDIFRNWLSENKDEVLKSLNSTIFKEEWDKYASGTLSAWEMEVMCFYYHEHELANLNEFKYGFVDFFELPEDPIVDRSFYKNDKLINIFKLSKICGTCIAKNKTKGNVTLLTPTGVVTVKFRKEYFSMFDKQISERGADGVKHVIEKSWFNRGSMIIVQGIRSGDAFIPKKYASSGGHQLYKITEVLPNGEIAIQSERYQGGIAEDGEY
jgi:DNA polymerase-3 subunit alpha